MPSSEHGRPWTRIAIPKDVGVCRANTGTSRDTRSDFNMYRHARSGRKVIIGPMPVVAFLNEFLPPVPNESPVPSSLGAFSRVPRSTKDEKTICNTLIDAIDQGKRCPSVLFRSTSVSPEESSPPGIKPSICGYSQTDMHLVTGGGTQPNLGLAEISFVVKKKHDPFCDSHSHTKSAYKSFFAFENRKYEEDEDVGPGRHEKRNLGQCVAHAVEVCMRQYRLFYFSVLVIGTRARLFRWDRAGGIVTKAFDFRSQPELMCEFLWRFHHANPVQRGFDPTISMTSQVEENLFKKLIREHVALQLDINKNDPEKLDNALSQHYEKGKVMKLAVYDRGFSAPNSYLVSVPLTRPKSVSGHATRAYWSVKLTGQNEGTVHFLKDTWRLDVDDLRSEGSIYKELEGAKVENICDLECHGDVPDVDLDEASEVNLSDVGEHNVWSDGISILSSSKEPSQINLTANAVDPELEVAPSQRSRTQEFINAHWVCECLRNNLDARIPRHIHSRMVLKQAGFSLRTFTGSRELFEAARDVLQALDSAYKRCRRVHRDISIDNIILFRSELGGSRKGLLVDWEFSSVVDPLGQVVDDLYPGTWAFMSGNALHELHDFRHTIQDDLESLFYVVLYGSVRWLPHNHYDQLGAWMHTFFDEVLEELGQTIGGREKLIQIASNGGRFLELFSFENRFLRDWFSAGYRLLGTTSYASRIAGETCFWTTEKLRELIAYVCKGLAKTDDTIRDRTEHGLKDYVCTYRGYRDTQISLFAAARKFRIIHTGLESRGERPLQDDDTGTDSTELQTPERQCGKRRRADHQLGDDGAGRRMLDKRSNTKQTRNKRRVRNERSKDFDEMGNNDSSRRLGRRTRTSSSLGSRRSPRLLAKLRSSKAARLG